MNASTPNSLLYRLEVNAVVFKNVMAALHFKEENNEFYHEMPATQTRIYCLENGILYARFLESHQTMLHLFTIVHSILLEFPESSIKDLQTGIVWSKENMKKALDIRYLNALAIYYAQKNGSLLRSGISASYFDSRIICDYDITDAISRYVGLSATDDRYLRNTYPEYAQFSFPDISIWVKKPSTDVTIGITLLPNTPLIIRKSISSLGSNLLVFKETRSSAAVTFFDFDKALQQMLPPRIINDFMLGEVHIYPAMTNEDIISKLVSTSKMEGSQEDYQNYEVSQLCSVLEPDPEIEIPIPMIENHA